MSPPSPPLPAVRKPETLWTVQLLGGLAARSSQREVTHLRTQKAASLLAYLAFYAPNPLPQPRDTLLELLWPEADLDAGRHNLSNALSVLRQVLEPAGVPPGSVLLADRAAVRLNAEAIRTDVAAFEELLRRGAAEGISREERLGLLSQAAELYQGPLLPGFYEDWIPPQAARLSGTLLRTVEQLVPLLLEAGAVDAAMAHAQRGVSADPLSETAAFCLMRAQAAAGLHSQALMTFGRLKQQLQEIGAVPSTEIAEYSRGGLTATKSWSLPAVPPRAAEQPRLVPAADAPDTRPSGAADPAQLLRGPEFVLLTTTRFFGREDEVAQLSAMLAAPRTRLVTLCGPGGTGKTRLALEVAARLVSAEDSPSPPRSAVFVSLADVADAGRVPVVILRSLGVARAAGRDVPDQVANALASRPGTLLILDNFEHVAEEGAASVRALLARAPDAKVLVTSRQKLRITGEHEFQLAPLPTCGGARTPEELLAVPSIALFVDRSQAANAAFELTDRNATAVSELCDRLEGIPLAIELAAVRVSVLSPDHILEQMRANRLDFLSSRRRDVDSRHRTLRATLEWSYRLLPGAGQQFLAQLSVFRGGWTLGSAEAVCRVESGEALEWLSELRDSSLIGVMDTEDGIRFSMLETVREYATEQLERSGQAEAAGARHAAHFATMMETLRPALLVPEGLTAIRQIARELENFRAALRWADAHSEEARHAALGFALMRPMMRRADWEQDGRWLSALRVEPGSGAGRRGPASVPVAYLLFSLGGLTNDLGDPEEATAEVAELVRLLGGRAPWSLLCMGFLSFERSVPEARKYADEALAQMREEGTALGVGCALAGLACLYTYGGEHERAREAATEAVSLLRDQPDRVILGNGLIVAGRAALAAGDLPAARAYFEDNMALRRQIGDGSGIGIALHHLGMLALGEGDFSAAERFLDEALTIYEEAGWDASFWSAWAFYHMGRARLGLGRECDAASSTRKALLRFRRRRSLLGACLCMPLVAELAVSRRRWAGAARLLGASETLRGQLGAVPASPEQMVRLRAGLIEVLGEARFAAEEASGGFLTEDAAWELALKEAPETEASWTCPGEPADSGVLRQATDRSS